MPALLKNLLLVAGTSVVMLLVAEGVVRIAIPLPPETMDTFNVNKGDYYRADPDLGWLPRPDVQGVHERPGSFESTFTTNSHGLRDTEHSFEKPASGSRMVVVGDSFAWGFGVNDGEIFTDVLESSMPNWEVINLGVTAFNLRQEIAYYERFGVRFDPDVLLVAIAQNDILEGTVEATFQPNRSGPAGEGTSKSLFHRLKAGLSENSALYKAVARTINANPTIVAFAVRIGLKEPLAGFSALDNNVVPALRREPPELAMAWETLLDDLRTAKSVASRSGARLIVAMIPARQSVVEESLEQSLVYSQYRPDDIDTEKPYSRIRAYCDTLGIEVVDPLPHFRGQAQKGADLYLPNDMHFNARGHELFADEILRYLRTSTIPVQ